MSVFDERGCYLQAAEFGAACPHARNDLQHRQSVLHFGSSIEDL